MHASHINTTWSYLTTPRHAYRSHLTTNHSLFVSNSSPSSTSSTQMPLKNSCKSTRQLKFIRHLYIAHSACEVACTAWNKLQLYSSTTFLCSAISNTKFMLGLKLLLVRGKKRYGHAVCRLLDDLNDDVHRMFNSRLFGQPALSLTLHFLHLSFSVVSSLCLYEKSAYS
jgi:hypothetical protein